MVPAKRRADQLLVEQGLAESRARAQALILAGQVFSDGKRIDKSGTPLPLETVPSAGLAMRPINARGAGQALTKLAASLRQLPVPVIGATAVAAPLRVTAAAAVPRAAAVPVAVRLRAAVAVTGAAAVPAAGFCLRTRKKSPAAASATSVSSS